MTPSQLNHPFNPYGRELPQVKYFLIFNKNAVRPPEGVFFDRESPEYVQNTKATFAVSTAFNKAAEKLTTQYPVSMAGLFAEGTEEISVHKDDVALIMKLLDGLKADGVIDAVKEIPKEESFHYAMTKSKITLH